MAIPFIDFVPGRVAWIASLEHRLSGLDEQGRLVFRSVLGGGSEEKAFFQHELADLQRRGIVAYAPPAELQGQQPKLPDKRFRRRRKLTDAQRAARQERITREASVTRKRDGVVVALRGRGIKDVCNKAILPELKEILRANGLDEATDPKEVWRWLRKCKEFNTCAPRHGGKGNRTPGVPKSFAALVNHGDVKAAYLGGSKGDAFTAFKSLATPLASSEPYIPRSRANAPRQATQAGSVLLPGYTWFRERLWEAYPQRDVDKAQLAPPIFQSLYRPAGGIIRSRRALQRVELDAHECDLFVSEDPGWWEKWGRGKPLAKGRPWVVFSQCYATHMPFGLWAGMHYPNASSLVACIRHGILPKTTWLSDPFWGCEGIWPTFGNPELVAVDNTLENHGEDLRIANRRYGTSTLFLKLRTPEQKGMLERFFRFMEEDCIHKLPACTGSNPQKRGPIDPINDPEMLTFTEFVRHLVGWIVDVYIQRPHDALDGRTPLQAWNDLLLQHSIRVPPDDCRELDHVYAEHKYGVRLDKRGVRTNKTQYFDDTAVDRLMYLYGPAVPVHISCSTENLGQITVYDPADDRTTYILKPPEATRAFYEGTSLKRLELILDLAGVKPGQSPTIENFERGKLRLARELKERREKRRGRSSKSVMIAEGISTDSMASATSPSRDTLLPHSRRTEGPGGAEITGKRIRPLPQLTWAPAYSVDAPEAGVRDVTRLREE
jgi:hypothetical protein